MITKYFNKHTDAKPLVVFRIFFGVMMFISMVRFWVNGWVDKLYIKPTFFFSYYGFEWIKPIGNYTYLIFIICALASIFVAIGFKYRIAIIIFFLSFTYIELMDKTTYLNHYYFVSVLSFLLIFLPANSQFSVDSYLRKKEYIRIPRWTIDSIKLLLAIVYFYAGLTKLNSDWLFRAMPLKIWLPSKYDLPLIGNNLMQQEWFHFAMSWGGVLYDLIIPFLLIFRKTRFVAFLLVLFFHVFTRVLFPIGMFPYIMILSTIIFFDSNVHYKIIHFTIKILEFFKMKTDNLKLSFSQVNHYKVWNTSLLIIVVFMTIQIIIPLRSLLYPGELFWNEQGYRFSWRVMLMEKKGNSVFKIVNSKTNSFFYVNNDDFLTPVQQKQMSFQPDMILEYGHYLGNHFKSQGHQNVAVFVESYVSLNGRLSQQFIDPSANLMELKDSFKHKFWIKPLNDEIKGF